MARNLITDVAGIKVGNADDANVASGVTAIVFDEPAVAAVDVRGGAPGDLLIDVSVAEHPVFRREGDELHMSVQIAIHEAGLGAKIGLRFGGKIAPTSGQPVDAEVEIIGLKRNAWQRLRSGNQRLGRHRVDGLQREGGTQR